MQKNAGGFYAVSRTRRKDDAKSRAGKFGLLVKAARRTVLDFYQNTRRAKAAFVARLNLADKIATARLN